MKENNNLLKEFIAKSCSVGDFEIGSVDLSLKTLSIAIRVYRQNSRQGTVACKDRGDLISRANRKPWKQKGTGRARAGSPRSPLWRGGGVCHGPQARTRRLTVTKKINNASMRLLFFNLLNSGKVLSFNFDTFSDIKDRASVKNASLAMNKAGLLGKKIVLFYDIEDLNAYYSFANMENVEMVSYDALSPYFMAKDRYLVFFEKDFSRFKSLVGSW
jgi:large subunit ribosomal protein L4